MPILFGVVLLDLIGFGIVIPILPFLSPQLGADKVDIALIIVTYAVCAGLCGPYWGRLSDRLGRKPVIMICLAGAALSYVLLASASQDDLRCPRFCGLDGWKFRCGFRHDG